MMIMELSMVMATVYSTFQLSQTPRLKLQTMSYVCIQDLYYYLPSQIHRWSNWY